MRKLLRAAVALGVLTLSACGGGTTHTSGTPARIVSLSPTATESLYAMGAGHQVVAVDDQSDYPAAAPRTRLSGYHPNAEAVIGYRPDLVVLSDDTNGIVAALRKVHIKVLLQPAASSLTDVYSQLSALGVATGHTQQANALVARMKQQIQATVSATPARRLTYYHELTNDLFTVTSRTFIGRLYALFGLTDIADRQAASDYPQLSKESLLTANPDLIFLADTKCCGQSPATVAARPGWSSLKAVRTSHVIPLDDDIASRWGPRIVTLLQSISTALKSTP